MPNSPQGPKHCPLCNKLTRLNTSGTGAPRFCPYCAWGTQPITPTYEQNHTQLPSLLMYFILLIASITLLVGPYLVYTNYLAEYSSDSLIFYSIFAAFFTCLGFFLDPIKTITKLRSTNHILIIIVLVIGSGALIAFTIRTTGELIQVLYHNYKNKEPKSSNQQLDKPKSKPKQQAKPQSKNKRQTTPKPQKQSPQKQPVLLKAKSQPPQQDSSRKRLKDQYSRKPKY
ncbi:hypothetical protein JD969_12075 [Planctomycetota bacterium]|nr:hypothetical protein JD969_12075 [Planctomycetota bacterium]